MAAIVLTADDANQVRGLTVKQHALAPIPMLDGNFILPPEVLDDPYHAIRHDFLAAIGITIGRGTVDDPRSIDVVLIQECTYNDSWPVGELIIVAV